MTANMRRLPFIAAFALVSLAVFAQEEQQGSPKIQVATRLVQINVVARDRGGPVSTLTKDDFVVTDQGRPQAISVFSMERTRVARIALDPQRGEFSNLVFRNGEVQPGVTILLLDNLNTLAGAGAEPYETSPTWLEEHALANAKNHLLEYLKSLDPNERVAIYSLSDELHVLCDFTSDRAALLAVVEHFDATAKSRRETVEPGSTHTPVPGRDFNSSIDHERLMLAAMKNQDRARTTTDALRMIAGHMAGIPGRKNLIWLTANLPFSGEAIARILNPAQIAAYPVDARGLLPRSQLPVSMMTGVDADDVAQARDNMPAASFQPIGIDAMRKMADGTGGRAFTNTNDLTGAIRDAVEDAEVSYTLGFYVESGSLDDKLHEIKVKVKRSDVSLRYPKSYFASKADPGLVSENRTRVMAIQSPLESSAIVLRARIERNGFSPTASVSISSNVDLHGVQLAQDGSHLSGSLDFYVLQQDLAGKVIDASDSRVNLHLSSSEYAADLRTGVPCTASAELHAETTALRVLVQDRGSSRIGTIIVPVSEIK